MSGDLKIKVRGLCKSFGRKVVLHDLDLDVPKGQSLVVIGGSGSGKSVLIKCIIGLMTPEKGSIEIDGQEVIGMSHSEREQIMHKFGMLFQGGALFDSLPVWENVAFGLIAGRGAKRREAKEIALRKLSAVGLSPEVGELFPAELSGGMQKRVSLARAIAAEPEIIFFDEPTTGLDPIMSQVINELINHDFEKLVFHLYRIDVDEARMRALLAAKSDENAGGLIADLIIERQLQKLKAKKEFSQQATNESGEEKW